jgi:DNA repair protein RadA
MKASGGNIIAHASTYRIYLRKSGENRIARMIDPYSDIRFTVNEKGVDDIDEKPPSKNKGKK